MPVSLLLVGVFAASAAACFVVAYRGSKLTNSDSRRGLRWLLIVVGVWAALQTGGLLVEDEAVATAVYTVALVVGFATVGPWLYFCSAYTGHEYHRRPVLRGLAVGTYLVVALTKVTNPIHGRYFETTLRTEPTTLLLIDQGLFYWGSFVLAYALTGIGFLLLYRLYRGSDRPPWTLFGLFSTMGLAVVPKLANLLAPGLVPAMSYEPTGVAVFAVGTSYFVEKSFLAEERATRRSLVERTAGGVLVVDAEGIVREHNVRAAELFPVLSTPGTGPTRIADVSETIAAGYRDGRPTLVDRDGEPTADGERTYVVTSDPLRVGGETFGYALLVQDVTVLERQRKRLERHERQLGDMAGAIAHELRNSITITSGYLETATDQLAAADPDSASARESMETARESVETARGRVHRIERIAEDLHTLVRYTHDAEEQRFVDFERAVRDAADSTPGAPEVVVEGTGEVRASPTRLKQVLKNAFRFATYNDARTVTVTLREDGFDVVDDGHHDAERCGDLLFEYESAEPSADAGMALPNVRALARLEGWNVSPDETYGEGLRYRIRGVRVRTDGKTAEEGASDEPVAGEGTSGEPVDATGTLGDRDSR